MINTLAAIHAAARTRKQSADGAKGVIVEVRKRRRPGGAAKEQHPEVKQLQEKADD